jgi:hypothetical protein
MDGDTIVVDTRNDAFEVAKDAACVPAVIKPDTDSRSPVARSTR